MEKTRGRNGSEPQTSKVARPQNRPRAIVSDRQSQQRAAKVLVVKDDAVSHRIVASSLRRRGFEVVPAKDAAEAIGVLQKNDDIATVFSDIVMPGEMDGSTLQGWIRVNRPGLPVILGSAHAAKANPTSHEEFRFFAKPDNMNSVAACIRSLIRETDR